MRKLTLRRVFRDETGVAGVLILDRAFCNTLEPMRCIPPGLYKAVRFPSPKFKTEVFKLKDVVGFTDIEIHIGNTASGPKADTTGCILVGFRFGKYIVDDKPVNAVMMSGAAFHELMNVELRDEKEIEVEVVNA